MKKIIILMGMLLGISCLSAQAQTKNETKALNNFLQQTSAKGVPNRQLVTRADGSIEGLRIVIDISKGKHNLEKTN